MTQRTTLAGILLAASTLAFACGEPADEQETQVLESSRVDILGSVPDFQLVNQDGDAFSNADLRGKVWVADFVFTSCETMCPRLTAEMASVGREFSGQDGSTAIQLVSFSVDPEHDTPPVLAEYAKRNEADPAQWTFLTGTRDQLWTLSKEGFKLPVGEAPVREGGPIFHSSYFVLSDAEGRIRGYYDALDPQGKEKFLRDARLVLAEASTSPATPAVSAGKGKTRVVISPPEAAETSWLAERERLQNAAAKSWDVFHDFRFTDQRVESGITFRHQVVPDAAKSYKEVHYDHGNGVAIADVDGDGLLDIYFTSQLGRNELWRNLGSGKFENITWQAGVAVLDRVGVSASFADTDNDGDPDLYVTNVRGANLFFRNEGGGRFTDVSKDSGVDYSGHSSGAVFFDYNRDGLLDLFLVNVGQYTTEQHEGNYFVGVKDAFAGHLKPERTERSILFENQGDNRFVDVSEQVGLLDERWSGDATPIDANGDGWLDLYVLNMQGLDGFYENVEGKKFIDRSGAVFPRTSWGAMGVKAVDFDNDGDQDIIISDMHSDMSQVVEWDNEKTKAEMLWPSAFLGDGGNGIYGNSYFRNDGYGKFVEISDEVGVENFWPWGLSTGDLNADGWEDVFITSGMNYPWRYGVNTLLLNQSGKFVDAEFVLGVEPRKDGRTLVPWFDIDCAGADKSHRDCPKDGSGGHVKVMGTIGSRGSAIFDIDGDGDLDIVTNDFGSEPMVLVSNLSEKKKVHYVEVKLVGTKSNRDGLGSTVTLKAGGKTLVRVLDGQSGYLSQSIKPLYFGLGDATQIDSIHVRWISGAEQRLEGPIEINRRIEITEGS